jgi:maleylacetate reductase
VLGGTFNLPHADTHTVVLPYVLAFNSPAVPTTLAALRRALGTPDPALGLYDLAGRLGAPRSLAALGLPREGIERAVGLAAATPYANPREASPDDLRAILTAAYEGAPPATGL